MDPFFIPNNGKFLKENNGKGDTFMHILLNPGNSEIDDSDDTDISWIVHLVDCCSFKKALLSSNVKELSVSCPCFFI